MPDLYLTPAAIGYLTQVVLALAITAYLGHRLRTAGRRAPETGHLRLAAGIFVPVSALVTLLFGDAALAPTPRLFPVYLENTVIGLLLTLLLQFAYAFPRRYPQRRREARLALALSLAYTLWEAGFALYRGRLLWLEGLVLYRSSTMDYFMVFLFLCVPMAFLHQALAVAAEESPGRAPWRPQSRTAQATRAFALIMLIPLGLGLLTLGRDTALIHPAMFQTSLSAGILLTQFLFALNYLTALPTMMSFQVRLVGVTLLGVLAVFGAVGWALTPPHAAVYRPALAKRQTLRFTPNAQGGYDVTPLAFQFDPEPGAPLVMEIALPGGSAPDAQAAVPFTFPFYGQIVQTLWVMQSGAVGVGAPLHIPSMESHYAATPAIFPLFVTLNTAPGGVFAKDAGERLTLTWQGLHGWHDPQATYTFQLVLQRDGVFTMTTQGLPDVPYESNTSPFSNVWVTGATPGLREQPPQQVNFADGPLQGGPQGLLQDHYLEFRAHLHRLLAPLALLLVLSSIAVALGFPVLSYASLSRPLSALLAGIRRVRAGDLQTTIPIYYHDEVGFLAESFNDAVAQQRALIATLETRVAERTADLTQANARLHEEIDQRETAQAQLLVQQRTLAAIEERERLGRDLHDGLGQMMGYLNVQSQTVQTLLAEGQAVAAQANLQQMAQAAQDAHADIRSYILGLRQPAAAPGDLRQTLAAYLRQFTESHGIQATLSYPADPPCAPFAPAVEEQVVRIVQEALTNVRKHAAATRVELLFSFTNDQAQVIISDDGAGFEIGDRGLGTGDRGLGTGDWGSGIGNGRSSGIANPQSPAPGHFGLAVMRERAAQVGGRLEVRSAPGQGTQVILALPCVIPQADGRDDVSAMRVLLVDDHPLFLDGLRNLLLARGINVIGLARDGLEAQAQARALRPNLIVMDLHMPRCNGVEATRAIKAELPETRIVMLTVSEDEQDLFEAIKAGAAGYLLKNLDAGEFVKLLAAVMRDEAPLPPALAARLVAEWSSPIAASENPPLVPPESHPPLLPPASHPPLVPPARGEGGAPAELTQRQWEILQLVAQGMTYREAGAALHLSEAGVKYHMGRILDLLHLTDREQALAFARQRGDTVTR